MGWAMGSVSSGICRQQRPRSASISMQFDQGLHCLLTKLLDTTECMNAEQRPGSGCAKLMMSLVNVSLKIF